MWRFFIALWMVAWFVTGCDSATSPVEDATSFELDEKLERLITLEGQRKLDNFVLPSSTDFELIPQDPKNPLTSDKVLLGQLLFHEPALSVHTKQPSGKGTFSCATCHHAKAGFAAGRQQSIGEGGSGWGLRGEARRASNSFPLEDVDATPIRSPSILNVAYQRVMLWSGAAGANGPNQNTTDYWSAEGDSRFNYLGYDGIETQALLALSNHRLGKISDSIVSTNPTYQTLWNRVFPGEPVSDEKAALAIAAFERTVLATESPFQRWLKGDYQAMTNAEKRGALVFFGPSNCSDCHTGPALNSMAFYALGMPDLLGPAVIKAPSENLGRGQFIRSAAADYTFKVPQLYNMKDSPFLGHGGTFPSVGAVIDYYEQGIPAVFLPQGTVTDQFHPLTLTVQEKTDLITFLQDALHDPNLKRYEPTSVPSGGCIPANDLQSRIDLGCR